VHGGADEKDGECLYNTPVWASYAWFQAETPEAARNQIHTPAFMLPEVDSGDFCHNWTPQSWHDEVPE
jgi:hypothetical protein